MRNKNKLRANLYTFQRLQLRSLSNFGGLIRGKFLGTFFLLFFLVSTDFFAQDPSTTHSSKTELRFQRFYPKDGLSHVLPHGVNIIQDKAGFIWIPSMNGLNRFDGQHFKVYQYQRNKNTGPTAQGLSNICEDSEGKLWVGILNGGINIFDPETETFELLEASLPVTTQACWAKGSAVFKDREGDMWVSTPGGICRCLKGTRDFKKYNLQADAATAFLQQRDGTIWVGGRKGLFQYVVEADSFLFYEPFPDKHGQNSYNKVAAMAESKEGEIWFTSKWQGQGIFNPKTKQFRGFPSVFDWHPGPKQYPAVKMIYGVEDEWLWFGKNHAIVRLNTHSQAFQIFKHDAEDPWSCQHSWVVSLLQDKAGSLWSASVVRGGFSVVHQPNNPFQVLPPNQYWEAVSFNDRQMLFATPNGFVIFDIYKEQIVPEALPFELQTAKGNWLQMDAQQNLWWRDPIQKKVFRYDADTKEVKAFDLNERFWIDSKNNLWLRHKDPIYYNTKTETFTNFRGKIEALDTAGLLKRERFVHFAIDKNDALWVGTERAGFAYFDPAKDSLRIFQHRPEDFNTPSAGAIRQILEGKNGWIYFRSDTGLDIYQPKQDTFLHFDKPDGMHRPMIEAADNQLWFSTRHGISKLDLDNLTIQDFDENDGLPYGFINARIFDQDARGWLYFWKNGTVFRFHPDSVQLKDYIAPIVFTDFYLNHQKVSLGERDSLLKKTLHYQRNLVLNDTQSDFGFRFVSPTFYKSDKIQYFYQLENYDRDWVAVGNELEAHFTNIPAGDYRFRVKAQSVAGTWAASGSPIQITVLPPWWETTWAYLLYVFALGAGILGIYKYQLRKQLAEEEALRLKELDELKTRLYTNITHEFRTPLTVIQGMADQIEKNPKEARQLIRRNSKNLLHLVTQLLDMSKLESQKMELQLIHRNIISYLRYLTQSFESYAQTKNIQLSFTSGTPELVMDYDAEKIQHILANLLSNAIKFTQKGGKIEVEVSKSAFQSRRQISEVLRIKVRDNGIGIRTEHLPHIFDRFYQSDDSTTRRGEGTGIGLALAKELVELMDGTISVQSELGQGTAFKLLIPIKVNDEAEMINDEFSPPMSPTPNSKSVQKDTGHAHPSTHNRQLTTDNPQLLLIEDNADVARYIQTCLEADYQITFAYDGKEGVEKAIEQIPDVIISDVMMPEKDGFEVTQILKNDERTSHIPIILLTAKADVASKIQGLERGADAYLAKPFDKKELLVRLEKLIELRRKLQARYAQFSPPPPSPDLGLQIEDAFLQKVKAAIEPHLSNADFSVPQLCKILGMSRSQLFRKIKALTTKSIAGYVRSVRLHRGKELLQNTDKTISEIAYDVGFTSPAYFSRVFSAEFGATPTELRN